MKRRPAPLQEAPARPVCCPPPWSRWSADLLELDGLSADLSAACVHTLAELETRRAYWRSVSVVDLR